MTAAIGVIGALCRDTIRFPFRGEEFKQPGGGVLYAARAISALGGQAYAFPILAKKDKDLLKALNAKGIKLFPIWAQETTEFENTYPEESLDVAQKKIPHQARDVIADGAWSGPLEHLSAVHLAPLTPQEFHLGFCKNIRKWTRGIVSLDAQGFVRGEKTDFSKEIRDHVDILKVNEEEALQLSLETSIGKAIQCFQSWNISEILVTQGSRGADIYAREAIHHIAAYPPRQIVDATGCGDTFSAAYLLARVQGKLPMEAGVFAAKAASQKLERRGPLGSLVTD